jgi:hypothetical protein
MGAVGGDCHSASEVAVEILSLTGLDGSFWAFFFRGDPFLACLDAKKSRMDWSRDGRAAFGRVVGRGFWMPGLLFLGCPGFFLGVVLVLVCFSGVSVFGAEVGAYMGVLGIKLQSTVGLEIGRSSNAE